MGRERIISKELTHVWIVGGKRFLEKADAERYLRRVEKEIEYADDRGRKVKSKRDREKIYSINNNEATILGPEGLRHGRTDRTREDSRAICTSDSRIS